VCAPTTGGHVGAARGRKRTDHQGGRGKKVGLSQQVLHNILFYCIVVGVAMAFMALASRRGLRLFRLALVGGLGAVIGVWCALIVAGAMGWL
jgi:hypothetical protein